MKVTINTINEISISHLLKTDINNLTKIEATTESPKLYWCKGILFSIWEFSSEEIIVKQIGGIWYIDSFIYSECKQKISQSKYNGFTVEVIDFTGHSTFEKLIDSLSEVKS